MSNVPHAPVSPSLLRLEPARENPGAARAAHALEDPVHRPQSAKPRKGGAKAKENVDQPRADEAQTQKPASGHHRAQDAAHELAHPVSDGKDRRHRSDAADVEAELLARDHHRRRVRKAVSGEVVARITDEDADESEEANSVEGRGLIRGLAPLRRRARAESIDSLEPLRAAERRQLARQSPRNARERAPSRLISRRARVLRPGAARCPRLRRTRGPSSGPRRCSEGAPRHGQGRHGSNPTTVRECNDTARSRARRKAPKKAKRARKCPPNVATPVARALVLPERVRSPCPLEKGSAFAQ